MPIFVCFMLSSAYFCPVPSLQALRHTIESHSRPKLNRQARFACGSCHLHFATIDTCCEHVGGKHPGIATAILKDGKLFKQVLIQPEKRKPAASLQNAVKNSRADTESQNTKIAWKRKLDRDQGQYMWVSQLDNSHLSVFLFRIYFSHYWRNNRSLHFS